jgi:hypothetical protein
MGPLAGGPIAVILRRSAAGDEHQQELTILAPELEATSWVADTCSSRISSPRKWPGMLDSTSSRTAGLSRRLRSSSSSASSRSSAPSSSDGERRELREDAVREGGPEWCPMGRAQVVTARDANPDGGEHGQQLLAEQPRVAAHQPRDALADARQLRPEGVSVLSAPVGLGGGRAAKGPADGCHA